MNLKRGELVNPVDMDGNRIPYMIGIVINDLDHEYLQGWEGYYIAFYNLGSGECTLDTYRFHKIDGLILRLKDEPCFEWPSEEEIAELRKRGISKRELDKRSRIADLLEMIDQHKQEIDALEYELDD